MSVKDVNVWCLWSQKTTHGIGVPDGCESLYRLGIWSCSSKRDTSAFKCWAISPAPYTTFKLTFFKKYKGKANTTVFHLYCTELLILYQVILYYINYSWLTYTGDKRCPFLSSLMVPGVINLNSMERNIENGLCHDSDILSLSITSKAILCLKSVNSISRSAIVHKVDCQHHTYLGLLCHHPPNADLESVTYFVDSCLKKPSITPSHLYQVPFYPNTTVKTFSISDTAFYNSSKMPFIKNKKKWPQIQNYIQMSNMCLLNWTVQHT